MRPNEQAQQDNDNYWHAVQEVAERIVEELNDADEDRNELLHRLLHENTDQHEYVINDELAGPHAAVIRSTRVPPCSTARCRTTTAPTTFPLPPLPPRHLKPTWPRRSRNC